MNCQEAILDNEIDFNENAKKITKIKFCIISNYGYMHLKSDLQNFALDYQF